MQIEFDFYKSLYYEELDLFQQAFIQKHNIFDLNGGSDEEKEYTIEEKQKIMRMFQMMEGMQDRSITPRLEG